MAEQEIEIQQPVTNEVPYSVTISQTAKGARVFIHCKSNVSLDKAIDESVAGYLRVRRELVKSGCAIAPDGSDELIRPIVTPEE